MEVTKASVNTGYEEAKGRIERARRNGARAVYLSGMDLTEVPEAIGQLTQLRELDLSRNQISSLPAAIGQLSQLQGLYLSDNQIASLPEAIGQLRQLQRLDLSNNILRSLPELLGQLKQLEWLNLSRNSISSLPAALSQLKQLQGLNLSHNSISSLPAALSQLKQLQGINLSNNPLDPELAAAYSQDTKTVRKFLALARSPQVQQVQSNEAKLILVGEGEVGKTSLLGALRGDPWVKGRETTHGIEIKPFTVKVPDSDTEIKLNGWDFGGQPVYRPTHQLFFSAPAVYLIVWKPRLGPQQAFVEYWITLVKRRAPEAKILVVATHCGPNERQPDINTRNIIQRFGSDTIQGFFSVDSKPDATGNPIGIDALKEAIARVAASLPEVGREVPAKWQQVREKLQATEKAYLSYDEVIDLCGEQEMDREKADLFLLLSHTLGNLIHYHNDPLLKKLVILKPDWLAKAISFVLDDAVTRKNEGLVDFSRLNLLWNNPDRQETDRYPLDLHPTFRKLMERFDLSYRVVLDPSSPEPDGSLIAQLVSDNPPTQLLEQNWGEAPKAGEKETHRICSIVDERGDSADAEGLFYQLIVRLHKYSLGRDDYRKSVHWKQGLLLDNSYNGRALLEHVGTDVRITVRAAYPENFIYQLTTEVKWLVEHFWKGLRCQVMVPCIAPCGKDEPGKGQFEVEKLIESKGQGMPKFPCTVSGCNQWQEIDQLLRNDPSQGQDDSLDRKTKELEALLKKMAELAGNIDNLEQWIKQLSAEQKRLLSQHDSQFDRLIDMFEAKDGPRLFNVQPIKPGFFDLPEWMGRKYKLTLWCEHSRLPLPALNPEGDKRGVYELELPRKWLVKAKPFLRLMARTLSVALQVPVPWIDVDIELKLDQVISGAIDQVPQQGPSNAPGWEARGEAMWAEGAMLRELHAILNKKDPTFGGLIRVQNKRRGFLWVHPKYQKEDEYS